MSNSAFSYTIARSYSRSPRAHPLTDRGEIYERVAPPGGVAERMVTDGATKRPVRGVSVSGSVSILGDSGAGDTTGPAKTQRMKEARSRVSHPAIFHPT